MVMDGQVKELRRMLAQGKTLAAAARMTEMSEKTARSYRDDDRLPSQRKSVRNYRTRVDPFADVWDEVQQRLRDEPRLKAVTLLGWLQSKYPGQFPDSTRRTLERRIAKWRSIEGPAKSVFFSQIHHAGRLAASDFTVCNELGVKIAGSKFDHMLFHCVLTYSNVESVSLCFSESFEALSGGIQKAFWEFGGVPQRHRSDSLSAAVRNHSSRKQLTERYAALMDHYGCEAERTNARCANENGDVESSNGHLKDRIDQALLLRGSRDFPTRDEYMEFVEQIIANANSNRTERFAEDQAALSRLPPAALDTDDCLSGLRVSKSSTIRVRTNTYSVPSRLIGRKVDVRISAEQIEVSHQGVLVQTMNRLVGKHGVAINYRHIIDSLVRKPGALANYQYREEMFPTTQFRIAYDWLRETHVEKEADKRYVKILEIAAKESQDAVAGALRQQIAAGEPIDVTQITELVADATSLPSPTDVEVEPPQLADFDSLLHTFDKECQHDGQNSNQANETETQASESNASEPIDRSVAGTSHADDSGSIPRSSDESSDGKAQSCRLSLGVNDVGMRNSSGGSDQAIDDSLQATAGQNLGIIQFQSIAVASETTVGDPSRRFVFESSRECSDFWETRLGEEPCIVCAGGRVDSARPQHVVHHVQSAGSATVDGETRLAVAAHDQDAFQVRGTDHRRSGIRPTGTRRDGSSVHVVGRTLRTRERPVDEQPCVQQMGSNLQGRHDDSRCNRSACTSQRDHRIERTKLPSRDCQENKTKEINRNPSCR